MMTLKLVVRGAVAALLPIAFSMVLGGCQSVGRMAASHDDLEAVGDDTQGADAELHGLA